MITTRASKRKPYTKKPVSSRFFAKVNKSEACWLWTGAKAGGYGLFFTGSYLLNGTPYSMYAHRWLWEEIHGKVPEKQELDHLCRNRACVNPDHLEPVNRKENGQRAQALYKAMRAIEKLLDTGFWETAERTTLEKALTTLIKHAIAPCAPTSAVV